jgi:hypothetical protein
MCMQAPEEACVYLYDIYIATHIALWQCGITLMYIEWVAYADPLYS